jgi:hypothetical protein
MARRYAKPAAFLFIVFLLTFLVEFQVQYRPPQHLTALTDEARAKVLLTEFNGQAQLVNNLLSADSEEPPDPVTFSTKNMSSTEIVLQPRGSLAAGCTTDFYNTIEVNITTYNELEEAHEGVLMLTVTDINTNRTTVTHLYPLDLQPKTEFAVNAVFHVITIEPDPVFDIKASFPNPQELGNAQTNTEMSLLEYILTVAGIRLTK